MYQNVLKISDSKESDLFFCRFEIVKIKVGGQKIRGYDGQLYAKKKKKKIKMVETPVVHRKAGDALAKRVAGG